MQPGQKENPAANGASKYTHQKSIEAAYSEQHIIESFTAALNEAGLSTNGGVIADGKIHREYVNGDKSGSKNGWYILFNDGVPVGCFGSWKTGFKGTWCAKADYDLTQAQRIECRRRMVEAQKAREVDEEARREEAGRKALTIWQSAPLAPDDHPYLLKKGVRNYGLRLYKTSLVVPLHDNPGNLHSLQFIDEAGNKRFLSGGRKKGCYFVIGCHAEPLCIAEGYATAASIYESIGLPVVVAFDAGNLLPVAQALRMKFPTTEMILCADNDENTPGNPGLTKAQEAAIAIGASLAVPPCAGDFNDLYQMAAK